MEVGLSSQLADGLNRGKIGQSWSWVAEGAMNLERADNATINRLSPWMKRIRRGSRVRARRSWVDGRRPYTVHSFVHEALRRHETPWVAVEPVPGHDDRSKYLNL
jgi:hypothetical protein